MSSFAVAENNDTFRITHEERREQLEFMWTGYGHDPDCLIGWLQSARNDVFWNFPDNKTQPHYTEPQKVFLSQVFPQIYGGAFEEMMSAVAIAAWESRKRTDSARDWCEDFYPVMDGLLLVAAGLSQATTTLAKLEDPRFANLDAVAIKGLHDLWNSNESGVRYGLTEYSLEWITFHLRYYVKKYLQDLRRPQIEVMEELKKAKSAA